MEMWTGEWAELWLSTHAPVRSPSRLTRVSRDKISDMEKVPVAGVGQGLCSCSTSRIIVYTGEESVHEKDKIRRSFKSAVPAGVGPSFSPGGNATVLTSARRQNSAKRTSVQTWRPEWAGATSAN